MIRGSPYEKGGPFLLDLNTGRGSLVIKGLSGNLGTVGDDSIEALAIRIGLGGILYTSYHKEPHNSYSTYLRPLHYSTLIDPS